MTKVLWLVEALVDLRGIKDYIAQDNPVAARRIVRAVKDGVEILKDHPGIGRPGRLAKTRELVIRNCPYIVAYREVKSAIHILAVVHTSRRWPDQLP
ncbi:MAG: type II toxin-antitoxin system RelE/ParE family toxin [Sterolibacterium sp.]|jgi:addiction module RelE/StbE family toxin